MQNSARRFENGSIFFPVVIIKFERMGPVQARPRPS
jgi:hypothetical protein